MAFVVYVLIITLHMSIYECVGPGLGNVRCSCQVTL